MFIKIFRSKQRTSPQKNIISAKLNNNSNQLMSMLIAVMSIVTTLVLGITIIQSVTARNELTEIRAIKEKITETMNTLHSNIKKVEISINDDKTKAEEAINNNVKYFELSIKALTAERTGDWEVAIKAWESIFEMDNSNTEAIFGVARSQYNLSINSGGDSKRQLLLASINNYKKMLMLEPDSDYAFNNLGVAYSDLADIEPRQQGSNRLKYLRESQSNYEQAVTINTKNTSAYCNLGSLLLSISNEDDSINATQQLQLLEQARKQLMSALAIDKKNKYIHINLARVAMRINDLTSTKDTDISRDILVDAQNNLNIALSLDPYDSTANYLMGIVLGKIAQSDNTLRENDYLLLYKKSIKCHIASVRHNPKNSNYINSYLSKVIFVVNNLYFEDEEKLNYLNEAINFLNYEAKLTDNNSQIYLNWGLLLRLLSQQKYTKEANAVKSLITDAITKFRSALRSNPLQSDAYAEWGYALVLLASPTLTPLVDDRIQLHKKAQEKFQGAYNIDKSNETLSKWAYCQTVYYNNNHFIESIDAKSLLLDTQKKYEDIIMTDPNNIPAQIGLATILIHLSDFPYSLTFSEKEKLVQTSLSIANKILATDKYHSDALVIAGMSLTILAQNQNISNGQKKHFLLEAISKFNDANKPDDYYTTHYWGVSLLALSSKKITPDNEKRKYYLTESTIKLQKAITIITNNIPSLHALRLAYSNLSDITTDRIEQTKYKALHNDYLQLEKKLLNESNAYDMACKAAIRDDSMGCFQHLLQAKNNGTLPSCSSIKTNRDFESMLGQQWFQNFLDEVCPEYKPANPNSTLDTTQPSPPDYSGDAPGA